MNIAIYYDNLIYKGGAERVILQLAEVLHADVITSGYHKSLDEWVGPHSRIINIGNITMKFSKEFGVLFESPLRFLLCARPNEYDVRIFAGFSSVFASGNTENNIFYCFTPNRLFYENSSVHQKKFSVAERVILKIYKLIYKRWSEEYINSNFKNIITQSKTAKSKIGIYLGQNSHVIYNPLDTKKFYFTKYGDFFLCVGRLYSEKRVDLVIKAFSYMPNKKLIIVGDGPENKYLKRLAMGKTNITFLGNISETELLRLYATCLATVYFPLNEEFGLIPVEGMAAGKPCIGVNEGGCRETIIDGQNGYLVEPLVPQIVKAVSKMNIAVVRRMKAKCLSSAKQFNTKKYANQWHKYIALLNTTYRKI